MTAQVHDTNGSKESSPQSRHPGNTLPSTSRFFSRNGLPEMKNYVHKLDDSKVVHLNNQTSGLNYNPFTYPQAKPYTQSPEEIYKLLNKIWCEEGGEEGGEDLDADEHNIPTLQVMDDIDPITFVETNYEMGKKYGAIKVKLSAKVNDGFQSLFHVNNDSFWFQTNRLINNPNKSELELRLQFYNDLISFHLKSPVDKEKLAKELELARKDDGVISSSISSSGSNPATSSSSIHSSANPSRSVLPETGKSSVVKLEPSYDQTEIPTQDVDSASNNGTSKSITPAFTPDPEVKNVDTLVNDMVTNKHSNKIPSFLTKLPIIDKRPLDLYRLFKSVSIRGGYKETIDKKLWAQVGRELGYKGKIMTSLSTSLRITYLKILYPFEIQNNVENTAKFNENGKRLREDNGDENGDENGYNDVPLIIGSNKQFKRKLKVKNSKGILLNSNQDFDIKQPNTFSISHFDPDIEKKSSTSNSKRKQNKDAPVNCPITPQSQLNHVIKGFNSHQSILDDSNPDSKSPSVYNLKQFMEKDAKFQQFLINSNNQLFNKVPVKSFFKDNPSTSSIWDTSTINLKSLEQLYWEYLKQIKYNPSLSHADELESGTNLPTNVIGSGFTQVGDSFLDVKHSLSMGNDGTTNANPESTLYSLSPWNLKNVPILPNSLFGALNENDINNNLVNTSINVGMTFSSENWRCEDHFTQLINYQFFGGYKKWYFIPELEFGKFEDVVKKVNEANKSRSSVNNNHVDGEALLKCLVSGEEISIHDYSVLINSLESTINSEPSLRSSHINPLFQSLIDYRLKRRSIYFNQDFLITPELLKQNNIKFYSTVQKPGEVIIKFPKTYSSTISFGTNLSEEVNFATSSWLPYAIEGENWLLKQQIIPNFSVFRLIANIIQLYDTDSAPQITFDSSVYDSIRSLWSRLKDDELLLRSKIRLRFPNMKESTLDEKAASETDIVTDDDLSNSFPSQIVLTDLESKLVFRTSPSNFLNYVDTNDSEVEKDKKTIPIILDANVKVEMHCFLSDEKIKTLTRILDNYTSSYDDWFKRYETLMKENSTIPLKSYKTLLTEGEKIESIIDRSHHYNVFTKKALTKEEESSLLLFKECIRNLKSFLDSANKFIEECQTILSIKYQQRVRGGNEELVTQYADILPRLVKVVEEIQRLNFFCPEIDQILEFKNEIENFDRACRLLITKPKPTIQELNDLINLGQSFGTKLTSLEFIMRIKDRIRWMDCYSIIVKGGDPFNDRKDIFSLSDLIDFYSQGMKILGKVDLNKMLVIQSMIENSRKCNNEIEYYLNEKDLQNINIPDVDKFIDDMDDKIRLKNQDRIFVDLNKYDTLMVFRGSLEVVEKFYDFKTSISQASAHKYSYDEIKILEDELVATKLPIPEEDMFILKQKKNEVEDFVSSLNQKFKDIKLRTTVSNFDYDDNYDSKLNVSDELMHQLLILIIKTNYSFAVKDDQYNQGSSYEAINDLESNAIHHTYCMCREYEYGTMIECDKCKEWYHESCVQKEEDVVKIIKELKDTNETNNNEAKKESEKGQKKPKKTSKKHLKKDQKDVQKGQRKKEDNENDDYDDSDEVFICQMCELIESGRQSNTFLSQQMTYFQLIDMVEKCKKMVVYPKNEFNKLTDLNERIVRCLEFYFYKVSQIKQSEENSDSKLDQLRFILRKVYGAGILLEDLHYELLSTIRRLEIEKILSHDMQKGNKDKKFHLLDKLLSTNSSTIDISSIRKISQTLGTTNKKIQKQADGSDKNRKKEEEKDSSHLNEDSIDSEIRSISEEKSHDKESSGLGMMEPLPPSVKTESRVIDPSMSQHDVSMKHDGFLEGPNEDDRNQEIPDISDSSRIPDASQVSEVLREANIAKEGEISSKADISKELGIPKESNIFEDIDIELLRDSELSKEGDVSREGDVEKEPEVEKELEVEKETDIPKEAEVSEEAEVPKEEDVPKEDVPKEDVPKEDVPKGDVPKISPENAPENSPKEYEPSKELNETSQTSNTNHSFKVPETHSISPQNTSSNSQNIISWSKEDLNH